ncbi:MAG: hypothetical protein VX583_06925 [Bdellovibrionota bacterium]|nr:hypothetical protein [Pseudobdellovibrionaceae bacterium]|tara:strand:- start:15161 stop:15385 length:225 start_codon:yes stop_codon:yes gene_type:complete
MQAINILIALALGFSAGNMIAGKSQNKLKAKYLNFIEEVADVNKINRMNGVISKDYAEQIDLNYNMDPNLRSHR